VILAGVWTGRVAGVVKHVRGTELTSTLLWHFLTLTILIVFSFLLLYAPSATKYYWKALKVDRMR
jgi:hypothetical protein